MGLEPLTWVLPPRRGAARGRGRGARPWPFGAHGLTGAVNSPEARNGSASVHARAAWRAAVMQAALVPARGTDSDLIFLSRLARHVVDCRECAVPRWDGTPEDWLWRAVRKQGMRDLVDPLDRAGR